MNINQSILRNLDNSSKKMIHNGVYSLYMADIPGIKYLLKVSGAHYFGLDNTGLAIKEFSKHIDQTQIKESVFFENDCEDIVILKNNLPISI